MTSSVHPLPAFLDRELSRLAGRFERLQAPLANWVPWIQPAYRSPRHLAPLLDVIQRAEREPVRAVVSVPPRFGKTESLLMGAARYLARDPTKTVGFATHSASLSRSKSRSARDYARRAGVQLSPEALALNEWRTRLGGGFLAAGVGGTWTGHGVDLLIVDDALKDREEAESPTIRQKIWDWFTSTALTRVQPGGSVIVNMTRWHDADLIGRLMREGGGRWEVVNIPALDEHGESIWPEQWSTEELRHKAFEVGAYDWASLFMGQPRPRGGELFRAPVRYEKAQAEGRRIMIGVDPAATAKRRSDYSVAIVLAYEGWGADARADVLDVFRKQIEIPDLCTELETLQRKWNAPLVIEDAGVGIAIPQMLRRQNPRLRLTTIHPQGDKFLRAQGVASAWNAGHVRVPADGTQHPWVTDFLEEVLAFTGVGDRHDDCIDALSHAWNHAASTAVRPVHLERGPHARPTLSRPTDEFGRAI